MNRIFLYIVLFTLLSCANNPEPIIYSDKSGIPVSVIVEAGKRYKKLPNSYLPAFFNIATLDEKKSLNTLFIIPGEKRVLRSTVNIKPICIFRYEMDTILTQFIISEPTSPTNDFLANDFMDFNIQNGNLKMTIENWFKEQCPAKNCSGFRWGNTYQALLALEDALNIVNKE